MYPFCCCAMKLNAQGECSTEHCYENKYFQQYVIYTAPPMNCKAPLSPPQEWHHQWSFSTSSFRYTSDIPVWWWTVPWGHNDCHLSSYRRVGQKPSGDSLQRQVYSLLKVIMLLYTLNHLYSCFLQLRQPRWESIWCSCLHQRGCHGSSIHRHWIVDGTLDNVFVHA